MLALLLACGSSMPSGLVAELSAIHEVPPVEDLRDRYPGLVDHLEAVTKDDAFGPIAQDRAWLLLSGSPDERAAQLAVGGIRSSAVPPATRYKALQQLVDAHPRVAAQVALQVACDEAGLVRRGAVKAAQTLSSRGREVRLPECGMR